MKALVLAFLLAIAVLCPGSAAAQEQTPADTGLHNSELYASPWADETPSKGTFSVRHEGIGEPPEKGYFREHEPGEVAEFHLFVPAGLDPAKKYPLLIVFHGGKDGASGKGMCGNFAQLSTTQHPVIVLAPNMYTLDAMNELLAEGELPIDRRRVVVFGHSSGGMGVRAAMAEYRRTVGEFVPAALISASTTASAGDGRYPPCTYFVLAGEQETPAHVTNEILRERRRTCRVHALEMQPAFQDVRYVELQDSGHEGGTPAHKAIIQHALAVSEHAPVILSTESRTPELARVIEAARSADWTLVHAELARLEREVGDAHRAEFAALRTSILIGFEEWFAAAVAAISAVSPDSPYVVRDGAFARYDRCAAWTKGYADTPVGATLASALATLGTAKHWQAELAARDAYLKIARGPLGGAMKAQLAELRASAPHTEYGRNRTREKLLALEEIQNAADLPAGPLIVNPYYARSMWRVWRNDATPVENVTTLVHEGNENKQTTITLQPTPVDKRIYPIVPQEGGAPVQWRVRAPPPGEFAGVWDDVYASWSGLHGYVRPMWQAVGNNKVQLRPKAADQFMHFVEVRKSSELLRCGVNFVHQSTTGMAHTITNGYGVPMTTSYEKIYFSDCLVTAPAHASFTEDWADRTKDLYLALVPTLFNSVGSSNSETMAIAKWLVVGGYLPPESKRLLKLHGLYPGALLYLWKAALPYDVPYDHELRHRVAYRSLGDEAEFGGRYGHAGHERGNLALEFHRYSEIAHMRNMIRVAQTMTVLPPEAIFDSGEVAGGTPVYGLRKTVLVLQEPGKAVTLNVSTAGSYDLQGRPVSVRWKLLYGNHATTCEPGAEPGSWTIRVPWDATLPEGRTALAAIANNGVHDSNPAIVNVYRKYGDLPPSGAGGKGGGYGYTSKTANRRPVLLDLQDVVVRPGVLVRLPLRAVDPEGQPVRFYKRAGEPGELDGNLFTWKVPADVAAEQRVTFIASDATAGNSYAVKQVRFVVKPKVHAHITSEGLVGPAPFTVSVSSKGSTAAGKPEFAWEFYEPKPQRKAAEWGERVRGETATHTFEKPGLYEVALAVRSGEQADVETVQVWVTKDVLPEPAGGTRVEGNGVQISTGDETPSEFDHTQCGTAAKGATLTRMFELYNLGSDELTCTATTVTLSGEQAEEFRVARAPRKTIEAGGYATFEIEFRPTGAGRRAADVTVKAGGITTKFRIAGEVEAK